MNRKQAQGYWGLFVPITATCRKTYRKRNAFGDAFALFETRAGEVYHVEARRVCQDMNIEAELYHILADKMGIRYARLRDLNIERY